MKSDDERLRDERITFHLTPESKEKGQNDHLHKKGKESRIS